MSANDLHTLTLSGLRHRCAQESERFFGRQDHDPRFCFELFRRAIIDGDETAWDSLFLQYRPMVQRWVERHPSLVMIDEESQYFVNRAFEKMWAGMSPEKFATFTGLKAVLRYLQMCVQSVIVDYSRAKEHKLQAESDEALENRPATRLPTVEEQVSTGITRHQLWRFLEELCKDEKERQVLYSVFVLDLKPSQILAENPGLFSQVQEVYRIKENLLARLRRNSNLREFLGNA